MGLWRLSRLPLCDGADDDGNGMASFEYSYFGYSN